MNNDYLWDKRGTDAEVERLEDLLSVFRYEATDGVLDKKGTVIAFPERKPVPRSLIYALAACVTLAFVGVGLWISRSSNESVAFVAVPQFSLPTTTEPVLPPLEARKTNAFPPLRVKAFHTVRGPVSRNVQTHAKRPVQTLTSEERYAYDQLMLALSITSSKLQMIRETINPVEKKGHSSDK